MHIPLKVVLCTQALIGCHFTTSHTSPHAYPHFHTQGMWIAQTLDKVKRHRTPWVVVSFHRMMNWMSTDTRPTQVGACS